MLFIFSLNCAMQWWRKKSQFDTGHVFKLNKWFLIFEGFVAVGNIKEKENWKVEFKSSLVFIWEKKTDLVFIQRLICWSHTWIVFHLSLLLVRTIVLNFCFVNINTNLFTNKMKLLFLSKNKKLLAHVWQHTSISEFKKNSCLSWYCVLGKK